MIVVFVFHQCFSLSPPFSHSKSLTASLLNHLLISSTLFYVSIKLKQCTSGHLPASHQTGYETLLAIADQNNNIMDEIWNYLSWRFVHFDFKHALIGFCV